MQPEPRSQWCILDPWSCAEDIWEAVFRRGLDILRRDCGGSPSCESTIAYRAWGDTGQRALPHLCVPDTLPPKGLMYWVLVQDRVLHNPKDGENFKMSTFYRSKSNCLKHIVTPWPILFFPTLQITIDFLISKFTCKIEFKSNTIKND